ncbi:MAG: SDR family oxidoreductase [Nanoarchaeota archaeon]|nr:SDR family oxidoreductase [Nanoarchaeota archaeon]
MKELAIITGGSKGIGKAFAEGFLKNNISVYLLARTQSELEKTQQEFQNKYPDLEIKIASIDATSQGDVEQVIDEEFSSLDTLYMINNAGVWLPFNKETFDEDLDSSMSINYESPKRIAEYALRKFDGTPKKLYLITNLSHIVFRDFPGNEVYKPTKMALWKATSSQEHQYWNRNNIFFYQIYPGVVASDFAVEEYKKGNFDAPTSLESLGDLVADLALNENPTNDVYIANFQKDVPELGLKKEDIQGITRIYLTKDFKPKEIQRINPEFDIVDWFEKN